MKSRDRTTLSLSAVAVGLALALPSQVALATDCAEKMAMAQNSAQAAEPQVVAAAADAKPLNTRVPRTGSNIVRVRSDGSLPVSEYDRTYIDRTGAATTSEMLRSIPQVQLGR